MTRGAGGAARSSPSVLVVAGEASGDRIAAEIATSLARDGVPCFGMGGPACRAAGVELVADLRQSAAMGLTEVAARLPAIVTAFARLVAAARDARPAAAVLVDYTEFNLRLGALLKRRNVPVLWCVAPQVWAWRPSRTTVIARALDRLAVILPFEAPLWRDAGVDAHYVGHPALDAPFVDRAAVRARLGLGAVRPSVAILPGSRAHEVRRHTVPMLAAIAELARAGTAVEARVLVATSLDHATRAWLHARAERAGVSTIDVDAEAGAARSIPAFDAALSASGTATLECALAGAPPVIVYRLSPLSAALARRFVRTPFVGLPNILLGSNVYPELLDRDAEPGRMARALAKVIEQRSTYGARAEELRARLAWNGASAPDATENRALGATIGSLTAVTPVGASAAERAASLLGPWLAAARHGPSRASTTMSRRSATSFEGTLEPRAAPFTPAIDPP